MKVTIPFAANRRHRRLGTLRVGAATILLGLSLPSRAIGQALPQRSLVAVAELVISAEEHDLSPIAAIRVSGGGRVAIWQQQDLQVKFVDSSGRSLGRFGRKGEGPGDFRALGMRGGWVADTFWVTDPSTRRITTIGPNLRLVRSEPWPQAISFTARDSVSLTRSAGLVPYARYSDGTILSSFLPPPDAYRPPWLPTSETRRPFVRTTGSGRFLKLIAWDESMMQTKCIVTIPDTSASWAYAIPFCALPMTEVSGNGQFVATALPIRDGKFRLTVMSAGGDTVFTREVNGPRRLIPKQVADSALRDIQDLKGLSPLAPRSFRAKAAASVKTIALPQAYPPFVRLIAGEDGSAWVEIGSDRNEHAWLGTGRDGKQIGIVVLAENVALKVAAGPRLWAVTSNRDGVQDVVRYGVGTTK